MAKVKVLDEQESWRLITDGTGRFAVIEARAGFVYSLDPHHAAEAKDGPAGMAAVVGPRGWKSRDDAQRLFDHMVRGEQELAERLW